MTLSHSLNHSSNKIVDVLIEDIPLKSDYPLYSFSVPVELEDEIDVGKRVFVPFGKGNRLKKGIVVNISKGKGDNLKNIFGLISKYKIIDENGLRVLFKLKDKYYIPINSLLKKFTPLGKSKKGEEFIVLKDGYENKIKENEKRKIDCVNFILENDGSIKLNTLKKFFSTNLIKNLENRGIVEKIYKIEKERETTKKDYKNISLTKEEIKIPDKLIISGLNYVERWKYYVKKLDDVIKSGNKAKVIFPERIYVDDFYDFLPDEIKKFTYKVTGEFGKKIREDLFQGIEEGYVKLIIGTAFSLLLPLNEKLIIIDMEDRFRNVEELLNVNIYEIVSDYIEESDKKVIFGAYFPSLNLTLKAKRENIEIKKERLHLKNIKIIYNREDLLITPEIKNVINKNKDKKIFIFYPRKGYFTYFLCDECGYVEKCPNDGVPLTYFSEKNKLVCKICGFEKNLFDFCPVCGGITMKFTSPGTERVKERIKKIYKDRNVYQLDESITGGSKKKREEIEKEFMQKGDIIVGTNIILPLLRKVNDFIFVFLNIDFVLNFPEYDSFEDVFYLIIRILEESEIKNSKVFIQTKFPKNIIFESLNQKNLYLFLNEELRRRKESKFPPYAKYITIENFDLSYTESLKKIKDNEDEIYFEDNVVKIKTKNIDRYKEIFDKIKFNSRIIIKEF